jgi:hypothetical protein
MRLTGLHTVPGTYRQPIKQEKPPSFRAESREHETAFDRSRFRFERVYPAL